ncbi:hypothetical protein KFU94_28780 [Chloroflexi bacterium TSY]|nr:hypothetical protein [Chloroflexi bacterium TSY]
MHPPTFDTMYGMYSILRQSSHRLPRGRRSVTHLPLPSPLRLGRIGQPKLTTQTVKAVWGLCISLLAP